MKIRKFIGHSFAAIILASVAVQPVAAMQFGGIFGGRSSNSDNDNSGDDGCETEEPSIGRTILGRALGRVTRDTTREMGTIGTFIPSDDVAEELTDTIACRLDPEEQQKAADATLQATRGEQVGSSASWSSETREGVSGTSTVTSRTEVAGGSTCMNVTDVIIVNGEETTETKRMCRAPGAARYTLVA